jgi:hypothetical protein
LPNSQHWPNTNRTVYTCNSTAASRFLPNTGRAAWATGRRP